MDTVTEYQIVLSTCPNAECARRMADELVRGGLAACVNILPSMQSVYRWRGQVESAEEHLLVIKGRANDFAAIQARVLALHPYELPEIIAVPIVGGLPAYLSWLNNPEQ